MESNTEPRICCDCGGVIEGPICDGQICIYSGTMSYSEYNDFMKKEYGNLPERPDLPEPPEDDLPW